MAFLYDLMTISHSGLLFWITLYITGSRLAHSSRRNKILHA